MNLEVLKFVDSGLRVVPHSIGCLSKLRELDVSLNRLLETLPDTIMHCKMLEKIDVSGKRGYTDAFKFFPGWMRELPALKEVNSSNTKSNEITWMGNIIQRKHHKPNPDTPKEVYNPNSLQALALSAIISNGKNMSVLSLLPTNSHYQVENYLSANNVRICAHCRDLITTSKGLLYCIS